MTPMNYAEEMSVANELLTMFNGKIGKAEDTGW
jgi:hypothetical protein